MPRRLYWLKMRDDFFGRLEIKRLRKMPGGDTLVLIYERLLLLSLKTDGILTFHGYEQDLAEELALDLDEEIDSVRAVLIYMQGHDLIHEIEPNRYQLEGVLEMTGSESDSAERVRRYRERRAELPETAQSSGEPLQTGVTNARSNGAALQSNTEKEKREKKQEIETEPEKETETETEDRQPEAAVPVAEQRFAEFWKLYPKKVGKAAAMKAWKRAKIDADLFDRILEAVEAAKESEQWQREGGRFIPNPTTWINQGRWDDELPEVMPRGYESRKNTGGRSFSTLKVLESIAREEEADYVTF